MNKNIKLIINYLLGPLLFVILAWSLYKQIIHQPDLEERWQQIRISWKDYRFWIVFILMFMNWGLEARKWQLLIAPLEKLSLLRSFKAIMAGCSITMLTPNRIGEYGGRIMYVSEPVRIRAISLTILGSISQLAITMLMGTIALFTLRFFYFNGQHQSGTFSWLLSWPLFFTSVAITVILLLLFFRVHFLIRNISRIRVLKNLMKHIAVLDIFTGKQLLRILFLSFFRYMVFILQYVLLLKVMEINIPFPVSFLLLSTFYLLMVVAPTVGFTELPVRATASLMLLGLFSTNTIGIQAAAFRDLADKFSITGHIGEFINFRNQNNERTMKNFTRLAMLILVFCTLGFKTGTADFCGIKNKAFKEGEVVIFEVFYNALGAYIGAGEATFTTTLERFNGKPVYHHVGEGKSYSFFDNFFKVRDRYESYVDTGSLLPYKFLRNVDEGGHKIYNNVTFNQAANTAASTNGVFKITDCMQDVISMVYYARNIDFAKYKADDKIPFDMFLDDEIYHLYIRYVGKEKIKTRYGKFNAIKIKPLLIKGTLFEGGEKMTAWISDDPNHIILRVESPISVGSIKVDMMSYKNLRYPLTSFRGLR